MILSVKKTHLSVVEARKDIYLIKTSNIIPVKLLKIDNGHDVIASLLCASVLTAPL